MNNKLYQTVIFDIFNVLIKPHDSTVNDPTQEPRCALIEGGVNLLKQFINNNYTCFALSNANQLTIDQLLEEFPAIFNLFTSIVTSQEATFAKPDQRIFSYLLKKYNLDPATCIFIDDSLTNVQAAESLGITGIHFINENYANLSLKKLKIL